MHNFGGGVRETTNTVLLIICHRVEIRPKTKLEYMGDTLIPTRAHRDKTMDTT